MYLTQLNAIACRVLPRKNKRSTFPGAAILSFKSGHLMFSPALIWRRTSFGTHTQAGSTFVARMLTVVATLKSQRRDVLEFMTQAVVAARGGKPAPCLLPEVVSCSDEHDLLSAA